VNVEHEIKSLFCDECRNGYALDADGFHSRRYNLGDSWECWSHTPCRANPVLVRAILSVLEKKIAEINGSTYTDFYTFAEAFEHGVLPIDD
jgi:hypothetical protein